jgi:hypothetical protein
MLGQTRQALMGEPRPGSSEAKLCRSSLGVHQDWPKLPGRGLGSAATAAAQSARPGDLAIQPASGVVGA